MREPLRASLRGGFLGFKTRIWRVISIEEAHDSWIFQDKKCYISCEDKLSLHALKQ
jgi:hypothetical protein